jgi:hypothetical protein
VRAERDSIRAEADKLKQDCDRWQAVNLQLLAKLQSTESTPAPIASVAEPAADEDAAEGEDCDVEPAGITPAPGRAKERRNKRKKRRKAGEE